MRAAVFREPRVIEIVQVPLPEPGPGQLRVRLVGCGVCGSNLPVWEGRSWFEYPLPPGNPGHEGWGTVEVLGPDTTGPAVGTRVAFMSDRAFAEYDLADAAAVVPLPETLANLPFPGEPLACAMNVFARCNIAGGQRVAVVGSGFLGSLLVQLAAGAGAQVVAISRRPFALQTAAACGAAQMVPLGEFWETLAAARAAASDAGYDCVIECVGNQAALDLAGELVRVRGRLVIAGYHQDGLRSVNLQSWNWRGIDVVNAHERDPAVYTAGLRSAVAAVLAGQLDPAPLITHTFPLAEIGAAFEALCDRPAGFLKAVVLMDAKT